MTAIRVGIGGWNFPPWRGTFYPAGLPHAQELAYASRHLTSIEINSTFYGSQKPASFVKWRDEAPDGFVFSVKGPRFATHRRDLTEASDSIERFLDSGVLELGPKLGPILWQFPPTRQFDPDAMRSFLDALPPTYADQTLRHVIEARHPSFASPAWIDLLRQAAVAHAIVESAKHVMQADVTAPFVYVRLEHNSEAHTDGYDPAVLDKWAHRVQLWAAGKTVEDLPHASPPGHGAKRECFIYFISGDKVRAPTAAMAFLRRLGRD